MRIFESLPCIPAPWLWLKFRKHRVDLIGEKATQPLFHVAHLFRVQLWAIDLSHRLFRIVFFLACRLLSDSLHLFASSFLLFPLHYQGRVDPEAEAFPLSRRRYSLSHRRISLLRWFLLDCWCRDFISFFIAWRLFPPVLFSSLIPFSEFPSQFQLSCSRLLILCRRTCMDLGEVMLQQERR
jgi:hypothetical protein